MLKRTDYTIDRIWVLHLINAHYYCGEHELAAAFYAEILCYFLWCSVCNFRKLICKPSLSIELFITLSIISVIASNASNAEGLRELHPPWSPASIAAYQSSPIYQSLLNAYVSTKLFLNDLSSVSIRFWSDLLSGRSQTIAICRSCVPHPAVVPVLFLECHLVLLFRLRIHLKALRSIDYCTVKHCAMASLSKQLWVNNIVWCKIGQKLMEDTGSSDQLIRHLLGQESLERYVT